MDSVEEFLAHTIQLENEAALRFGQLADAMRTAGNTEVAQLFRQLAQQVRANHGVVWLIDELLNLA